MLPNQSIALKVQNLGKAYRVGVQRDKDATLAKAFINFILQPIKNFKNIQSLKNATAGENLYWANRNISFELKKGEVLGIIGKNGAGKSTLLKLLSRITPPTEGRMEIYGRVASLLEVGTGFNPDLTGRENIFLNGTILGLTKKEINSRFESIVEFSGIAQFIDTPVKRYSSGMKVRLAFAVAAHLDPEILIIDEVLAVGDAEFQKKCLGKMQEVAGQEGRTVLFVSHDMAAVKKLCTRALLLNKGEIVKEGHPDEVVNYYLQNASGLSQKSSQQKFEGRKGNGVFKIEKIELLNEQNQILTVVDSGTNLKIAIHYTASTLHPNPVVNINFYNQLDQRVFNCLSRVSFAGILPIKNEGKIICSIPKLPLMPGRYRIDTVLKFDQTITDEIEGAMYLDVEKGDFFGTGKLLDDMRDGLLVNHYWETDDVE